MSDTTMQRLTQIRIVWATHTLTLDVPPEVAQTISDDFFTRNDNRVQYRVQWQSEWRLLTLDWQDVLYCITEGTPREASGYVH